MNEFNLEDLMLRKEEATNPRTHAIKTNKKFNDENLVNFSVVIITHYIKNKIRDSPEIEEIIIDEDAISSYDQVDIFYSLLNLSQYKNIKNDSLLHITKENIRDCLSLLYEVIKGSYYEEHCNHLIHRILEILKVKGYDQCDIDLGRLKIQITKSTNDKE